MSATEKTVFITGSSKGIGFELARLFARDGYSLILNSRSRSALEEQAAMLAQQYGCQCRIIEADLSEADSLKAVADQIGAMRIDVLVNNAGFGLFGRFVETDLSEEMAMIDLNVKALVTLTKSVLPSMIAAGQGRILNVASMAGFVPGPFMAIYYATKAFVVSFSEAIAEEVKDSGVIVSVLCPGPTATEFQKRAGLKTSKLARTFKPMTAQAVAQVGYDALMKGESLSIPGVSNRLLFGITPFVPRQIVPALVRKVQEARD